MADTKKQIGNKVKLNVMIVLAVFVTKNDPEESQMYFESYDHLKKWLEINDGQYCLIDTTPIPIGNIADLTNAMNDALSINN